jgi:hypothetical protein
MKFHRLFWLVVSAGLLLSTVRADEVVMKNGDRVTGIIVKQDGKTITVKTDNFGVVTAPWDKAYERLLKPGLLQLWSGGGSAGFAGTDGNAQTSTFTMAFNAARTTTIPVSVRH